MSQIFQRTDQQVVIPVTDRRTGAAADLSGASAEFFLARGSAAPPLVHKTMADGVSIAGNTITVQLTSEDTDRQGPFYCECVVTDALSRRAVVCATTITNTNDNF